MSSLQVDSISSMGGGHVDGAGKVVQFKSQVYSTETSISANTKATLITISNFQPLFSDSLIHYSVCHQQDSKPTPTAYCSSIVLVEDNPVIQAAAYNIAYNDTGLLGQRYNVAYNGTGSSWGTTPKDITLRVDANTGGWTACLGQAPITLTVWEIAQ